MPSPTLAVDREQALAYRIAAHGLHRADRDAADLGVLDLGVQHTNAETVRLALAARLTDPESAEVLDEPAFTLAWSLRGAPHLHRTDDLPLLASRLWPVSDADAMARLAAERAPLKAAGVSGLEAFTTATKAMRKAVTREMTKGDVSTKVSAAVPESYTYDCRSCKATHIYGGLFQSVGLFAGVRLVPDASPTSLAPLKKRPKIPTASAGPSELFRAYLRLHGPATPADAASFLGTTGAAVRQWWPDDLVEVRLEGRKAWVLPDTVDALREPPEPPYVRLLPPYDPLLQARDRGLLVPDRQLQKQVWRILANPGAVLADGEIVGTWRSRLSGAPKARTLAVTVEAFERVSSPRSARLRRALEEEAARFAAVRGAAGATVTLGG